MTKKLTFGELNVGDKFIAFPVDGDNEGHGGYLGTHWIFQKIRSNQQQYENAVRRCDGGLSSFSDKTEVIKVG